jgi:hypothetical protein
MLYRYGASKPLSNPEFKAMFRRLFTVLLISFALSSLSLTAQAALETPSWGFSLYGDREVFLGNYPTWGDYRIATRFLPHQSKLVLSIQDSYRTHLEEFILVSQEEGDRYCEEVYPFRSLRFHQARIEGVSVRKNIRRSRGRFRHHSTLSLSLSLLCLKEDWATSMGGVAMFWVEGSLRTEIGLSYRLRPRSGEITQAELLWPLEVKSSF